MTVTVDVALFVSLVAVMVADPAATPDTSPVPETVATLVLLELHVMVLPLSAFPRASLGVAVNWVVPPMNALEGDGATVTVETGTRFTVTVDVPDCPSLVAVIVVVPGMSAVTSPD